MALLQQCVQQQQQQQLLHGEDLGALHGEDLGALILEKMAKEAKEAPGHDPPQNPRTNTPFGVKALQGQRPNMEDANSIQMTPPSTAQPAPAPPRTPPQQLQQQQPANGPAASENSQEAEAIQVPVLPEDLVSGPATFPRCPLYCQNAHGSCFTSTATWTKVDVYILSQPACDYVGTGKY